MKSKAFTLLSSVLVAVPLVACTGDDDVDICMDAWKSRDPHEARGEADFLTHCIAQRRESNNALLEVPNE